MHQPLQQATDRIWIELVHREIVDSEIVLMTQLQILPDLGQRIVPAQTTLLGKAHADDIVRNVAEIQIESVFLEASLVLLPLERREEIPFPPHVLPDKHPRV